MSDIKKFAESAQKKAGMHSVTINNKEYTIQLLPARQAAMIGAEIFKLIAPSVGAWFDSENKQGFVLPEDISTFTEVSMLLVNQMDKVSVADIIEALTTNVSCNGQQVDIDMEFRGNIKGLIELIKFSLRENIGPFSDWPEMMGLKTLSNQRPMESETTSE